MSRKKNKPTESPIPLTNLKEIKSGIFSDGNEHCFTTKELHLTNMKLDEGLDSDTKADSKPKEEKKSIPPDKADIRYNPAMDTDISFNKKESGVNVDSVFSASVNSEPRQPEYTEADLHMVRTSKADAENYAFRHSDYHSGNRKKIKKRRKKKVLIALIIVLSVLAALFVVLCIEGNKVKAEVNNFKTLAYDYKDSVKETFTSVKSLNPDEISISLEKVDKCSAKVLEALDKPLWKYASMIPDVDNDIRSVKKLIDVVNESKTDIFIPLMNQLKNTPLSGIKADGGFNTRVILSYLDFIDDFSPKIESFSKKFDGIEFKTVQIDSFDEYTDKLKGYFERFDTLKKYEPLLRALCGNGEDRLYLVMAQNSAEIRASGGFPGSLGTISIQDGILTIGDFSSIRDFIYSPIVEASGITYQESELFGYMYATWAHDACYNMHFPRVAEITKVAYDCRNSEPINGIVSLTPVVIQRLLQLSGGTISLADGTVLDGNNATQILQRDMYYTYQSDDATAQDNDVYIDPLFGETAKKAMAILTENFDTSKLTEYIEFFETGFSDRTIMIWFANSEEQQVSVEAGCSGSLNPSPEKPVCGTYFSLSDPGKLGSFISIDPKIISSTKLPDGSTEYSVQVDFTNTLTDQYRNAGTWILGNYGGAIECSIYFTAPCGGTIYDFESDTGVDFTLTDYQGVQLYYAQRIYIYPGYPPTAIFKVTTPPGIEAPLVLEKTPTLQEYLD